MNRTTKQKELEDIFFDNDCIGIEDVVPRFGKTRLGINIAIRYMKLFAKTEVLIVTPSLAILQHWETTLIKHFGDVPSNFNVMNTDSILNLKSFDIDLLIIDEIHLFTTDKRFDLINGKHIHYSHFLGLTGSMPSGYNYKLLTSVAKVIARVTEEEAVENEWISPYIEYNVSLEFPRNDQIEYIERSIPISETLKQFRGLEQKFKLKGGVYMFRSTYDLITGCYYGKSTIYGYFKGDEIRHILASKMGWSYNLNLTSKYNRNLNNTWSPGAIRDAALLFIKSVEYRHDLMTNNIVKLNAILLIIGKLKDKKAIIFNGSINFAEAVKDTLNHNIIGYNAISYHSKMKGKPMLGDDGEFIKYKSGKKQGEIKLFGQKSVLSEVIEGTIRGKYDAISVVNAFDQGVDIPNIDLVLTTSGSTNVITNKQRTARGKTYYGDKVSIIINLFFDDFIININNKDNTIISRDKRKLMQRQDVSKLKNVISISNFLSLIV